MWLRDFFSKDFPNCRTMTYGYNASLKSKSVHTILDYSRTFLRALREVRSSDQVGAARVYRIISCYPDSRQALPRAVEALRRGGKFNFCGLHRAHRIKLELCPSSENPDNTRYYGMYEPESNSMSRNQSGHCSSLVIAMVEFCSRM